MILPIFGAGLAGPPIACEPDVCNKRRIVMKAWACLILLAGVVSLGACSSTGVGAAVGGATGAAAGGGVLGTIGGAAVGGVIGHEVGKRRDE